MRPRASTGLYGAFANPELLCYSRGSYQEGFGALGSRAGRGGDGDRVVAFLVDYSERSNIPLDVLLSVYLVVGKDVIFVLSVFQGLDLHFPQLGAFGDTRIVEVGLGEAYASDGGSVMGRDLKAGVAFRVNGEEFVALSRPVDVLGRRFVLCAGAVG